MNKNFLLTLDQYLASLKGNVQTGEVFRDVNLENQLIALIKQENERIIHTVSANNSQYFHVLTYLEQQGNPMLSFDNYDAVKKLSCLLPNRLIVTSSWLQGGGDMLLLLYHMCKDYIKNDLFELYIDLEDRGETWQPIKDSGNNPQILNQPDVFILTEDYRKIAYNEKIQVLLPWLYDARPEDYIELRHKYKSQFEIYSHHIDKIAGVAKSTEELTSLLVSEIKDAFIDIQIALEKKSYELNKKGLSTIVGSVLTAIPMLIPDNFANISPDLIASLLGATTFVGTVPPLINSFIDKKSEKKDDPYWILWKWSRITTKV